MISGLDGTLADMDDDGALEITVTGITHRVYVNDRDREVINKRGLFSDVSLFCRTTVSENLITLYGFLDREDRRTFDKLRKVDGIGVATALRVLSVMDSAGFRAAIEGAALTGSQGALLKVPGIGAKLAAKIAAKVKL